MSRDVVVSPIAEHGQVNEETRNYFQELCPAGKFGSKTVSFHIVGV